MNPHGPERESRHSGYTLVELVIVVLIIAILASVAVPSTVEFVGNAKEQAVVTQVQQIFAAAELYHTRHGQWPRNAPLGRFPEDFEGMLPRSLFTKPSPIGRPYDWNGRGTGAPSIGVTIEGVDDGTQRAIDALGDDGDLGAGWITRQRQYLNFELTPK